MAGVYTGRRRGSKGDAAEPRKEQLPATEAIQRRARRDRRDPKEGLSDINPGALSAFSAASALKSLALSYSFSRSSSSS
jgi:hypothetical protein